MKIMSLMSPHCRKSARSIVTIAAAGALMLTTTGCSSWVFHETGAKLAVRSQTDRNLRLAGGFDKGIYGSSNKDNLTVLLFDGPIDNPTQVVTLRMFWKPTAGSTPIDATATNATIHYVIFPGGGSAKEVGIYGGAGFVFPRGDVGDEKLNAGVWEANLLLADRSTGFADRLGQAFLEGRFNATRDDAALEQALRRINTMIEQRLGYPRLVQEAPVPAGRDAMAQR